MDSADSLEMEAHDAEQALLNDRKLLFPRFWVNHEKSTNVLTLHVKLPSCKREWIKVNVWNKRHFHLLAASELNRYKLQYKLPLGATLLDYPRFSTKNGLLTCRFQQSSPKCIVCTTTVTCDSTVESEGLFKNTSGLDVTYVSEADLLSLSSNHELVQPRYWITYDDNMALFEADLKGCNDCSQIKFRIANHRLTLLACPRAQRRYHLELCLESSTKGSWKVFFDHKVEILTCSIPLLGYYKCGRCIAEGIQVKLDDDRGQSAEKAAGAKEAIDWQSNNAAGKKVATLSTRTINSASTYFGRGFNFMEAMEGDQPIKSEVKISSFSETRV